MANRIKDWLAPRMIAHPPSVQLSPELQQVADKLMSSWETSGFSHVSGAIQAPPTPPMIATHTDAEMVMDMIRRGYAVMKLPEGGGIPEVLK